MCIIVLKRQGPVYTRAHGTGNQSQALRIGNSSDRHSHAVCLDSLKSRLTIVSILLGESCFYTYEQRTHVT